MFNTGQRYTMPEPFSLPLIPVKITRKGDRVKIVAGGNTLELVCVPGRSQTYSFVELEQFITKSATKLYKELIRREQVKEEVRKAFTETTQQVNDETIVQALLNETKGDGKILEA